MDITTPRATLSVRNAKLTTYRLLQPTISPWRHVSRKSPIGVAHLHQTWLRPHCQQVSDSQEMLFPYIIPSNFLKISWMFWYVPAPGVPTLFSSTTSQIVVNFTRVLEDTGHLVYEEKVVDHQNRARTGPCDVNEGSCTMDSLPPGGKYWISIRACTTNGEKPICSQYSSPTLISFTHPSGKKPVWAFITLLLNSHCVTFNRAKYDRPGWPFGHFNNGKHCEANGEWTGAWIQIQNWGRWSDEHIWTRLHRCLLFRFKSPAWTTVQNIGSSLY